MKCTHHDPRNCRPCGRMRHPRALRLRKALEQALPKPRIPQDGE